MIERDMVQVRLTDPFRFVVVGTPDYLARHGTPDRPEDLLRHECITFRSHTTGALYAWELERGRKTWRVPVRGSVLTDDGLRSAMEDTTPLGRIGDPEEIAATVLFLASAAGGYLTGKVVEVDGGLNVPNLDLGFPDLEPTDS